MTEKLLTIYYQESIDLATITEYIDSVDHLYELIKIEQSHELKADAVNAIYINENRIHIRPDWDDSRPAILFPTLIPFNKSYFLGIVFGLLGNQEKYPLFLQDYATLLHCFDIIQAILKAELADGIIENILNKTKFKHPFENYIFNHNVAIALNYAHFSEDINLEAIEAHYKDAIELAFEPEFKAYTLKYYSIFLIDIGQSKKAKQILDTIHLKNKLEDLPKFALEKIWCQASMKEHALNPKSELMPEIKSRLWEAIQYYENKSKKTQAAFLWMDAATLANESNSYAEALGYITKSISYFKEAELLEMVAQAELIKARLLYDWAQSGQVQFYKSSLQSYHEALKIFREEDSPEIFAEIHHQLGIIYAELPDENKKRGIWAALSASSFNEALKYYNKDDHPNTYGMISNNFGNAYTKYPSSNRTDNFAKAIYHYSESLSIRDADHFPNERAISLLNYLEASWKISNPDSGFNFERYNDMLGKANEVPSLTTEPSLLAEAEKHLNYLAILKQNANSALVSSLNEV